MLGLSITPRRMTSWAIMSSIVAALVVGSIMNVMSMKTEAAREVPLAGGITQVQAGGYHSCALASGQVYCWGANGSGQLGNNSTYQQQAAVPVYTDGALAGKEVTQVSTGRDHTCVVADGQVYCWGSNYTRQLGNNSHLNSSVPVAVDTSGVLAGKTVTQVAASYSGTCAIADGQVYCWGDNYFGQLGNNSNESSSVPVAVDTSGVLAGKTVTQITAGNSPCAIADGQVYCWGYNGRGQLGNNSTIDSSIPVAVDTSGVLSGKTVTGIYGSDSSHSCAIADGQAFCWGANWSGQLGNNSILDTSIPVAVDTSGVLAGKNMTAMAVASSHSCAVAGEQVYCWGDGELGQLGNNSNMDSLVPVAVDTSGVLSGKSANQISIGGGHGCTLADTQVYCWGEGNYGELGNGSTETSNVPVAIEQIEVWTPEIDSLSRPYVYTGSSSQRVTIEGRDFDQPRVTIGGVYAPIYDWVGDTQIEVTIPVSATAKDVDVVVTNGNGNGKSATLENGFSYRSRDKPVIDNVTTNSENWRTGVSGLIIISGSGFDSSPTVTVGGITATLANNLIPVRDTEIYAFSPAYPTPGVVDVVVTNSNGQSYTFKDAHTFMQNPASVQSVKFSQEGEKNIVTVTGSNFIDPLDLELGTGMYWYYYSALYNPISTVFVLNGTPLNWCTDGTGMSESDVLYMGMKASDNPPCYYLVGHESDDILVSPTVFKAWLPNDFDITAPGTISINGSPEFAFGRPANPSQPVQETVQVNDKPLIGTPEIAKRPTFSGIATPGAIVTVTVHSDPVSCTTTADEEGKWSCTLPQDLPTGDHTVYVRVVNPDNSTEELGPYAVTVSAGEDTPPVITNDTAVAATNSGIGAPNSGMERLRQAMASPQGISSALVALIAVAVAFLCGACIAIRRRHSTPRLGRR